MHELSIAMALIDLAGEASERLGAPRINAVHVSIGPLAGVVEEALTFSFEVAAAGTALAGARLVVHHAPLIALCPNCHEEKTIDSPQYLHCPACGAATPDIRSGRDLQLIAVEIPDDSDRRNPAEHPQEERPARS
jgi:hydrogenase nickel incorporation protein HypA/HybF